MVKSAKTSQFPMKKPVVLLLLAGMLSAQTPGAAPGSPKPLADAHVLATLDNQQFTVAQLRELLTGAPDLALRSAAADPREFLVSVLLYRKMRADSLKTGYYKKTPYRERLDWARMQILQGALFTEKTREFAIREEDARRYYDGNKHLFGNAKVRMIFIPGFDAQAKAKAAAVLKQAQAGADFAKLVTQYSEDPDSKADGGLLAELVPQSRLPAEVRRAIFDMAPGKVKLVPFEGEQYIFKLESINLKPWAEETKDMATGDLVRTKMDAWMAEVRKSVSVKIENEPFFRNLPRAAGPMGQEITAAIGGEEIKEETVLAEINGKKLTAETFTGLMKGISPEVRAKAVRQPVPFLNQYALLLKLSELAEQAGLDQRQPYKNQLRYSEEQQLSQAQMDHFLMNVSIGPDEQRKAYEESPARFQFSKVRVLYIAFSLTPPPQTDANAPKVLNEAEAKAKAENILAEIRAGKSFETMVRLHSQDAESRESGGEMAPLLADNPRIPDFIKNTIFTTKAGEVTAPLRLDNGYYLFKVEQTGTRSYDEVKDMLYEEIRQIQFQKWFDGLRSSFNVKIEDAKGFRQVVDEYTALAPRG
jgi:parvulin-like peptidyl-prolyl isomerase